MNRRILVTSLGALLALALGFALFQTDPDATVLSQSSSSNPELPTAAALAETTKLMGSNSPVAPQVKSPLAHAEAEWAQAALNHQNAEQTLQESEQAVLKVERDIEAIERFIEDLEERGEDPADVAEEGIAKFESAINLLQARLDLVERNEGLEAEARSRRDAAEAELARQASKSP